MNVNRLLIKNFKSISELELDFSSMKGLWEISGVVGSGKTSIGEALLYALFGSVRDKNNRDLVKWGEKHAIIEMDCFTRGHALKIRREINTHGSNPTTVWVDGEVQQFTNKRDTQSILESEYYDVPRVTLELLCIITFTGFKSISAMSASDSRKFLDQTFSLSVITDLQDRAGAFKSEVAGELSKIQREQYAAEKQISKIADFVDADICSLQTQKTDLERAITKSKEDLSSLNKKKNEEISTRSETVMSSLRTLTEIKNDGARKKKDIDFLEKGVCPTCGAKLDTTLLDKYKEERSVLLENYYQAEKKYNADRAAFLAAEEGHNKLISEKQSVISTCSQELSSLNEKLKLAHQCNTEIDTLTEELERLNTRESEQNSELSQWSELCSILSGDLRSVIIREYTPHINQCISTYMSTLGQPYRATVDENFKCTVYIESKSMEVPVSMLSTGQRKVLDLVIILSILTVLMNKVNFNICFADELLSNMDRELRDKMCMLLKSNLSEGQSMFLLCHAPLDKTIMDGTITVTVCDGSSEYTFS